MDGRWNLTSWRYDALIGGVALLLTLTGCASGGAKSTGQSGGGAVFADKVGNSVVLESIFICEPADGWAPCVARAEALCPKGYETKSKTESPYQLTLKVSCPAPTAP